VDPAPGYRPPVAGLLGRDVDHAGPPERVEVGEFRGHGHRVYGADPGESTGAEMKGQVPGRVPGSRLSDVGGARVERDHGDGPGRRDRAEHRLVLSLSPRDAGRAMRSLAAALTAARPEPDRDSRSDIEPST